VLLFHSQFPHFHVLCSVQAYYVLVRNVVVFISRLTYTLLNRAKLVLKRFCPPR